MFFTGMSSTSKDYMDVFVIKKKIKSGLMSAIQLILISLL